MTFVPLSLASVPAAAAVSAQLGERMGRRLPILGALLVAAGVATVLVAIEHAGAAVTTWSLLPGMVTAGIGLGLVAPTLIGYVLAAVDNRNAGAASGALNTAQQLGGAIGVALTGTVYFRTVDAATPHTIADAAVHADAMTAALWLITGIALLSALTMLLLPANRTTPGPAQQPQPDPARAPSLSTGPVKPVEPVAGHVSVATPRT